MLLGAFITVVNALFVVVPTVCSATVLAQEAVTVGQLPVGYTRACTIESAAGGVNIVLTLVAAACGVWRFGTEVQSMFQ